MYDDILEALRRNAPREAMTAVRELLALHPDDAQAYRLLAATQQQNQEPEAALASIDQAIALSPEDAGLHLARAGMLLGTRQVEAAQMALATAAAFNPNEFGAYAMQAQLALGRGDLAEAEHQHQLAARVSPEHPHLQAIEGMLHLHRGDNDRALRIITAGLERVPEDLQLRYALGFVYLQKAHWAFAEQTFRSIIEKNPATSSLRSLIADLIRRQGRPAEAVEMLAPLLADPATATPRMQRFAGELQLAAGRAEHALPLLLSALAAMPDDRATLTALIDAWERQGEVEMARNTLDAALATTTDAANLWLARLSLEPVDGAASLSLVSRWVAAMPDSVPALEAQMVSYAAIGQADAAETLARRIISISPGHSIAQTHVYSTLLARDPADAVVHAQSLLDQALSADARVQLLAWLAMAQDKAGHYADAVASWSSRGEIVAANQLPLHIVTSLEHKWSPLAQIPAGQSTHPVLLWGPPGSGVERIATLLTKIGAPLLDDRFHPDAFADGFQQFTSIDGLVSGNQDGAAMVSEWRSRLITRGIGDGNAIDWLVWWDNAFLTALRPHLPEGRLLVALRDPRDMLMEWLAFGTPSQLVFRSPRVAARWLAEVLAQVVALHAQQLYPHTLLRLDGIENDPQALADALGQALGGVPLPVPDYVGPTYLAPGRWRDYSDALAEPFSVLAPVARQLGYPEN